MAIYTCGRCGKEHDLELDPGFSAGEGCPECQDWVQCEHCGAWAEELTTINTGRRGSEEWCESCVDRHAGDCDHCGEAWRTSELDSVQDDGNNAHWCPDCRSNCTWDCADCGRTISDGSESHSTDDGSICSSCVRNYWFCEECDLWFPDGNECNCGEPSCGGSGGTFRVAGYGCHGAFKIRNNWGTTRLKTPVIGLEMEVGNFPGSSSRQEFGNEVYAELGNEFAYPTADGSLGEYGVEFIGHPIGAMDHIAMYEKYGQFFDGLSEYGATVSGNPSGCHTNFSMDCFVSDDAIRCAIIACVRFFDALMMFTDPNCREQRIVYCKEADLYSGEDPISQCRGNGKYSIVNIKPGEGDCGIVEFRLAGMSLDRDRHLAQIQLYHNLVAWANKNHENKEAASYAPFGEIFLPVLFQDSIKDVIECGEKIGGLPLGDPAFDALAGAPAEIPITTFQGAIGYVIDGACVPCERQRGLVYDLGFRARPGDVVTISNGVASRTIICTSACEVEPGGVSIYRPGSAWDYVGDCGDIRWARTFGAIRYFFGSQQATFPIGTPIDYAREVAELPTEFSGE